MNTVTYTLYIDDNGISRTGLTPSIINFIDIATGTDLAVSGTVPTISELSGGFYKFTFDWETEAIDAAYVLKIDAGSEIVNASQRYLRMRIEQQDNVASLVKNVQDASSSVSSSIEGIYPYIRRLVDIEQGSWKIVANQLLVYSPEGDLLLRHDLEDENGLPTSSNPFRRLAVSIAPLS
jgi:hypothetical protein